MSLDNAIARPCSDSTHVLNFMDDIVLPKGQRLSMPFGKFTNWAHLGDHTHVQTVYETRRIRLEMLIKQHDGKLANLNEAIGLERNHAQLARIRNNNARTDRPGKTFTMGDAQARDIEKKLSLGLGWMDTPPSYAELHGEEDPRTKVMLLMEAMPPDQWSTAVRLLDALAQPTKATGTHN